MTINQSSMFEKVETMRRQSAQREAEASDARAAAAEENRRRMPIVSAFVAAAKDVFGDSVKVTYAHENGFELGAKDKSDGIKLSETTVGNYAGRKK